MVVDCGREKVAQLAYTHPDKLLIHWPSCFHSLWERKRFPKLPLPAFNAVYVPTSCILPHYFTAWK